ncbi:YadA-like family protein [Pseudomonas sp. QE6]|uniref:YadA-like family protein n=1 Tax=Pseudomonas sp. QE6 TaxID=3242491 RepID=UPI0035283F70
MGADASATGQNALAAGVDARATWMDATAVGTRSEASAEKSTAIGVDAKASGQFSVAIGSNAQASAIHSLSLGSDSLAAGTSSSAFGQNAQAFGDFSAAFGSGSRAAGSSTATGQDAQALGGFSAAFGSGSRADGFSTAAGQGAQALGGFAAAFGSGSRADGYSTATGQNAVALTVDGQGWATAVGNSSLANKVGATAVGAGAQATGDRSLALGADTRATNDNSVALGAGSVTEAAVGTSGAMIGNVGYYTFAGDNPTGTVSVGSLGDERTITNVAAGRIAPDSTDAINGSQLFGTNVAIENLSNHVWNIDQFGTRYFHANSWGQDSMALGWDSVAIGMGAMAYHDRSVALGSESIADGSTLGNQAYLVGGTATAEVNIGDRRITGLSAGAEDSDAVNVAQLKAAASASVADAVMYDNSTHNSITLGGDTYDNSTHTGGTTITNVANGVNDSDAVNMSQLNETNTSVTNLTTNIDNGTIGPVQRTGSDQLSLIAAGGDASNPGSAQVLTNVAAGAVNASSVDAVNGSQLYATNQQVDANTTNISNIYKTGIKYFHANSTGADSVASGVDSVAIGMGAKTAPTSTDGIAIGRGADVSSNAAGAIAIGSGAVALGNVGAVTIGRNTKVWTGGVAVGDSAQAYNNNGVAVGTEANATGGTDSVAIGYRAANALGSNGSTIVGAYAKTTGGAERSTALGTYSTSAWQSTAVGANSSATGNSSLALGQAASATAVTSVALGQSSVASTAAGIAGYDPLTKMASTNTSATWKSTLGAVSVGNVANGLTRQITGLAAGTQATDAVNVAQLQAAASASVADAVMYDNSTHNSITLGGDTYDNSTHTGGTTITNVANGVNDSDAVNMSQLNETNTSVTNLNTNINNLTTNIDNGTIGPVQRTGTDQLSLIAAGGDASNPGSAQVLTNVAAGAVNASSVDAVNGSQLYATNQQVDANTTNISNLDGRVTNVEGDVTTLQGDVTNLDGRVTNIYETGTKYFHANSTGTDSVASGVDSVAIGMGAVSSHDGSVALGAGSIADGSTLGNQAYLVGGTATGEVNIGDRRITGLSAGAGDTDAVNVAQLKAVTSASVADAVMYDNSTHNSITLGGDTYDNSTHTGGTTITNVADGVNDSDAVNMSQLNETNTSVTNLNTNINNLTTNIDNGTIGPVQRTGTDQLSLIAAGGDASNPGNAQVLTNVAAGAVNASSVDAVNGSQLYATNQQVDANTTNISNLDGRVTNVEGDVTTLQGDVTNLDGRVTNVYETGTKYFHANSTGTDSVASGVDSVAIGMGAVSSHDGSVALGAGSIADGSTLVNQAYLVGGTATGEVNIGNRRITGLSAGADDTDAVNVAQLKAITSGSVADAVMYDNSTHSSITLGGPTYNSVTKVGGTKITNVARGVDDSDAVNMSQLNETNERVTNIDGRVTNIEGSITNINNGGGIKYFHANSTKADSVASGVDSVAIGPNAQASGKGSMAMGDGAKASADGSMALGQGASDNGRGAETYTGKYSNVANASVGTVSVGNAVTGETRTISNVADGKEATDAVNLRQLDGAVAESKAYTDNSVKTINDTVVNVDKRVSKVEGDVTNIQNGTDGMFQVNNTNRLPKPKATGAQSTAGGAGAEAVADNSTAIGSNAKARGRNSVAIGANSMADRENSVSVGSAGAERQITNVAAGTVETDAVNLGQLNKSVADITNNANAYTDAQVNGLRHDLNEMDDQLSAGIAGAMAMASLPQPYSPGASMAAAGVGNYRGQSSLAVGVSRISDNGKWVTKLQGSADSQGEVGVSVGVGYQW